ncbi:MAG: ABC transporter permease [Candidatus Dormibacteria bacterium]
MIRRSLTNVPAVGLRGANPGWRANWNLTRELAITNFKLKYTGSILGYAWSLVKPFLLFGTTYVVFVGFLLRGRTSSAENFPVELLIGIVLWTFFADATGSCLTAIVANGHMLRKTYFPRWIPVVASTLSAALTLTINLTLVVVIGLPLHWYHLGLQTLALPGLIAEMYLLAVGLGLSLSALFVFFRDLGHMWEILLQLLFYGSAIIFPFSLVPDRFRVMIALNPVAQMVEDARRALVSTAIPWSGQILGDLAAVPPLLVFTALAIGTLIFRRLSPTFAESL